MEYATEEVNTWGTNRTASSNIDLSLLTRTARVRTGGIYEISNKQSVGLEGYYSHSSRKNKSFSDLIEIMDENHTDIISLYSGENLADNYTLSANYMLHLDSVGSIFKILLDYAHNGIDDNQHYKSDFRGYLNYDTIYRSTMFTQNNLYTVNADISLQLNEKSTFNTGLKYTHTKMDNDILFEYQKEISWIQMEAYSNKNKFKENIAAVYGSFVSRIQKISFSLGLRGEYTYASPWTNKSEEMESQKYFKLFPTAYVMYPFDREEKHSLMLNYNRKIQRPGFNALNPFRIPASEYLYIEGNPELKAAFINDYSTSLNFFNRYNLTVGLTDAKGTFERVLLSDPDRQEVIIQRLENVGKRINYYVAANTSLVPAKWWQIYLNISGSRNEVKVYEKNGNRILFRDI